MDEGEAGKVGKCRLTLRFLKIYWKSIFVILWPIICLPIFINPSVPSGKESAKFRCLYIVAIMAGYWVTECIPLAITGLMPVFLFPLMNVMNSATTAMCYFKEVNMVFMGGLLLAICVENSNLHNRIALFTIMKIGCSPRLLHLGLMLVTMLLSMWLVNSATTAMMCPIIKAILSELENQGIGSFYEPQTEEEQKTDDVELELLGVRTKTYRPPRPTKCTIAFYLGVAYASSIGGLGTLVGTPTNLAYKGAVQGKFPDADEDLVPFVSWMLYNTPLIIVMTVLAWLWLQILYMGLFRPNSIPGVWAKMANEKKDAAYAVMKEKYAELGPMTWHESWVGILFLICMMLWFFRAPQFIEGWGKLMTADWVPPKEQMTFIKDSVPALLILFLMVAIPATPEFLRCWSKDPAKRPTKSSPGLVTWKVLQEKMAWGALFLLGGGFAIATAGEKSGMSSWLGKQLEALKRLPPYLVLALLTLFASAMTEMTSNTAICNIILPVLLSMAVTMETNPIFLGQPAAIACSFAFMLPVGTPANAIAAGYANIRTKDMAIGGSMVKVMTYVITIALFPAYGSLFWNIYEYPDWAKPLNTTSPETKTFKLLKDLNLLTKP